jgi:hypothetical protein
VPDVARSEPEQVVVGQVEGGLWLNGLGLGIGLDAHPIPVLVERHLHTGLSRAAHARAVLVGGAAVPDELSELLNILEGRAVDE